MAVQVILLVRGWYGNRNAQVGMVGLFVYFSSSACFPLLEVFIKLQAGSCKCVDYCLLLDETCSLSRFGNVLDKWKSFLC